MEKKMLKKALAGSLFALLLLVIVLGVHIYIVTRPGAPDEKTISMARIDLNQDVTPADASAIGAWLYGQKGVEHVLCNPQTRIVIFTYYPVKVSADRLVQNFKSALNYPQANRYKPSAEEMKGGCPVANTSFSYKAYNFIKHII